MRTYIEKQTDATVRNLRWGCLSTVGRSGCGPVAAYNVAVALGKNPDFRALLWSMERKHLPVCGGLLGMDVLRLRRWLLRRFGRAELCLLDTAVWEEKTRFCRSVVLFYKNKGLLRGSHFIAGTRVENGFVFHNAPQLPAGDVIPMHEAIERLKKAGHTPLILIVL